MTRSIALLAFIAALIVGVAPAMAAESRVALVIGNGAYDNVAALPNPPNDAADMAAELETIGFAVTRLSDVGKADFEAALADFADVAAGADIAVVFYAGHGMEIDRQNYLIPVDASLTSDRRLRFETISLDDVIVALEGVAGIRIVLVDACRNNPFAASMSVSAASRSIGRGLSRVEAPSGTVISFAAKEGQVADDGAGRNSPFTSALLANLDQPGLEIGFLFRKVRDSVLSATGGSQEPYISASLPGDAIFLVPPGAPTPAPAAAAQSGPGTVAEAAAPGPAEAATQGGAGAPIGALDGAGPGDGLRPGEAVASRGAVIDGKIDPDASVVAILDLTHPGAAPAGDLLAAPAERSVASAAEVGQVFGLATHQRAAGADIYMAASSAYGLAPDGAGGWAPGMWGEGGGPGTIWVLRAGGEPAPAVFADVTLDGRANTGAGIGNIAVDPWHGQLFASDLETGMIHRFALDGGRELGRFDHGGEARTGFFDAPTGAALALDPVAFDPASAARLEDCPAGVAATTPACWNLADFRRRIWGLGVRNDADTGTSRLFYAVWGSGAYGNDAWAAAGDDARNAIWSIAIGADGDLDRADVRREFYVPDFFTAPEEFTLYGPGHPVADIAFSACGPASTMLIAERGGLYAQDGGLTRPHEARVLRYDAGPGGAWQPSGRYDIGHGDRKAEGPPHIRANGAGGAAFGPGFSGAWVAEPEFRNAYVWASGDGLCAPAGSCKLAGDERIDGLQGAAGEIVSALSPDGAFDTYPQSGQASLAGAPGSAYMVALLGGGAAEGGPQSRPAGLAGDIAVYQTCPDGEAPPDAGAPPFDVADVPPGEAWPPDYYPAEPFPESGEPDGYDPGDYPPDPGGWDGWGPVYDLGIEKTGPGSCQEGGDCAYRIEVTNYGPDSYFGKMAVADKLPEGASLTAASPGWFCQSVFGSLACQRAGAVALAPGQTADIDLTLRLAENVPGNAVLNCGAIDWDAMGASDGAGDANDEACLVTPVTERFDLGIAKTSQSATCGAGGACYFVVDVTNHGPGDFAGDLAIAETLPAGTTLASVSGDWGCTLDGEALGCVRPQTLAPGESIGLTLGLAYPLATPDGPLLNCARIDFSAMSASDGFADIAPDVACDSVDIHHDGFDLEIVKRGPAQCADGGLCAYEIEVTNHGPNAFAAALAITDRHPAGSTVATPPPGWLCVPGGAPDETDCTTGVPAVLAPGAKIATSIEYQLANPVGADSIEACASFDWGAMPLDLPGDTNDLSCATTYIGEGFDLAAGKAGPLACIEGAACAYSLTASNEGAQPFQGYLTLIDTMPPGAALDAAAPGWTCTPGGGGDEVACRTNGEVTVLAGATATLDLDLRLGDTILVDTVENCARLDLADMGYSGDGDAANDGPACATTGVLDADIALFGGTSCKASPDAALPCRLSLTMMNSGGRAFEGMLAINGSIDPAVAVEAVIPPGAGWACKILGAGSYQCGRTVPLHLEPGEAGRLEVATTLPAGFAASHLVHRMWVGWPQAGKRDANTDNDATVSIVRVERATEDAPPAGPAPEPQPPAVAEPSAPQAPSLPELALAKTGPRQCTFGKDCTWQATVANEGPGTYRGVLFVDDAPPGGGETRLIRNSAGWSCAEADGAIGCRHDFLTLAPGQSARLDLTLRLPPSAAALGQPDAREVDGENCAAIRRPIGGDLPLGVSRERGAVFAVQHALAVEGYMPQGGVDGDFGRQTAGALRQYQRDRGLKPTGAADAATVETMLALIDTISADGNPGNDRACAATRFVGGAPPPPQCPAGTRPGPGGRCLDLCAEGERWDGRRCVSICRDDQRFDGRRCLPRCEAGERWDGRRCVSVCRDDQRFDGQRCLPRCEADERWDGRRCVSICRPDQRFDGQRCISVCKPGERFDGQACVTNCPQGLIFDGKTCRPDCGRGQTWNGQACVTNCPQGQRFDGKSCVAACGNNQRFDPRSGRCVPVFDVPGGTPPPGRPSPLPGNGRIDPGQFIQQLQPQLQQQFQRLPQFQIKPGGLQ